MSYEVYKHYNTDQIPTKQERRSHNKPTTVYFGGIPTLETITTIIGKRTMFAHLKNENGVTKSQGVRLSVGTAICSPQDTYSRKEGNRIAKEKAKPADFLVKFITITDSGFVIDLTNDFHNSDVILELTYQNGSNWPKLRYAYENEVRFA